MITRTAKIILDASEKEEVVVVVSAMTKITDSLIEIYTVIET
jgi:aspartokinase